MLGGGAVGLSETWARTYQTTRRHNTVHLLNGNPPPQTKIVTCHQVLRCVIKDSRERCDNSRRQRTNGNLSFRSYSCSPSLYDVTLGSVFGISLEIVPRPGGAHGPKFYNYVRPISRRMRSYPDDYPQMYGPNRSQSSVLCMMARMKLDLFKICSDRLCHAFLVMHKRQ